MYCTHAEILEEFTHDLQLKGRSEVTIFHYCLHTRLFLDWIQMLPRQVGISDIRRYLFYIYNEKQYALETIKLKIRSIKRFYEYLFETGQVLIDPCADIKEPRGQRMLPKAVMTPDEMESILQEIPETSLVKLRDRAIISVLYSTAIRLSELEQLDLSDVNLSEGMLHIRKGKGGHDRQAILNKDAVNAISLYLKARREIPDDSPALWINFKGTRLTKWWIQYMIRAAAKKRR